MSCTCTDRSLRDVSMDLHTAGCLARRRKELLEKLATPGYLDAAEALANAATPLPWRCDASNPDDVVVWAGQSDFVANIGAEIAHSSDVANGEFIATSRALFPQLIAVIRACNTEIGQLAIRLESAEAARDVWSGKACEEEQAQGNGPCGACRFCLPPRVRVLEAALLAITDKHATNPRQIALVALGAKP